MSNNKDDHLSELVRGAVLSFNNAEQLFNEANLLFANKALSRALCLHQISLEECGKIDFLVYWATSYLIGTSINFDKLRSHIMQHKVKNFVNAYLLPLSDTEQKARDESDWRREHEAFKEQQRAFHQESNDRKNASLYVDIIDSKFLSPSDQITEDMVHEIATRNKEFLELMYPKVKMLKHWVQNPDDTREFLKGIKQKMEALRDAFPDDPKKWLEVLLVDMMNQLKPPL